MKIRIKLWALVGMLTLSLGSAKAQIGKLQYRAEAGMSYSKIYKFLNGKGLVGMRLSGQVLLPFENSNFALVSGLTLTNKGEKFRNSSEKVALMYLQLPVEASIRMDLNKDNKIYLATGPYFAFNLARKGGDLDKILKQTSEQAFNAFEFGWGLNAMYAFRNIYLRTGVEISLNDVMNEKAFTPDTSSFIEVDKTRRNGLVYLSIGYQF